MVRPICPPKPRIKYYRLGGYWVLDSGHTDLLFDTWREAMDHAERICDDYQDRLFEWIADGNW